MAGRRVIDIKGRGFTRNEVVSGKDWKGTLIYDPDLFDSWCIKCLDILRRAKAYKITEKLDLSFSRRTYVYQQILIFWNCDKDLFKGSVRLFDLYSTLAYYDLIKIFKVDIAADDIVIDITKPTPDQEFKVCKCIIEDLWDTLKRQMM